MWLDTYSRLDGKVALITGAGRGIGRQIALGYAEAGARLVLGDLDGASAEAVAAEVRASGAEAIAAEVDVAQSQQVDRVVGEAVAHFGRLDIGVNNAGICVLKDFHLMTDEEWRRVFSVNLDGVFYCSRAEARVMIDRKVRGSIINMASMSGLIANHPQTQSAYNASKAAVIHFTRSIAAELARHGIRANAVSPGYIDTDPKGEYRHLHPAIQRDTPMGRLGRPEELRGVFLYLASEAASFVTGSNLVVDGGFTVW